MANGFELRTQNKQLIIPPILEKVGKNAQNHAQKEDDFLKMADDSILLRRRSLYTAELRRRIPRYFTP